MIQWMRRYNADPRHQRKVQFYGFDMQSVPRAVKVVLSYLRKVDPKQAAAMEARFAPLADRWIALEFRTLDRRKREATRASAAALLARFDARKEPYSRKTSAHTLTWRSHAGTRGSLSSILTFKSMRIPVSTSVTEQWPRISAGSSIGRARTPRWSSGSLQRARRHAAELDGRTPTQDARPSDGCLRICLPSGGFQAVDRATGRAGRGLMPFRVGPALEGSLDATLAASGLSIAAIDLPR